MKARMYGACAVVASEFHCTSRDVADRVDFVVSHEFHQQSGIDLVDVVREACTRSLRIDEVVLALATEKNTDHALLCTAFQWGKIYTHAAQNKFALLDVARQVCEHHYPQADATADTDEVKDNSKAKATSMRKVDKERLHQFKTPIDGQVRKDNAANRRSQKRENKLNSMRGLRGNNTGNDDDSRQMDS